MGLPQFFLQSSVVVTGVERWQMIPAFRNELNKKAPYESLFTIFIGDEASVSQDPNCIR